MLKQLRTMAGAALLLAGCATAPEPAPQPGRETEQPERPVETRPTDAPLRVGVIVSGTGSLKQYGDLVLEGARVAAEANSTARRSVELVVRDDGGTTAGAERALRELEQAGVRAVVGPLIDDALVAAARARGSDDLVLISPMAVSDPAGVRNAYALNVVDERGAAALGEYARRWNTVGVLYARTPEGERQARAFVQAYNAGGRGAVIDAAFVPTSTNVTPQLNRLRSSSVQAIFFPGSERELQIVLPQIEYAGLQNVQLLGTEGWLSDAARAASPRTLQGAIVATPLNRQSSDVAWSEFVERYEALHRRSLTSPVAALGYDAASLALRALTSGSSSVTDFRGATGVLSLRSGVVTRRPFLVRLDAGRLVPID
jgi:ABC-type branched-subunit amino acid transport system substrate-binding protein